MSVIGEKNPYWKGGKPNCMDCGKKLSLRGYKRCRICNLHFHSGKNHYLYGRKRPYMTGEKHPNWKNGVSSKNKLERIRFKQQIQKQVFERDDYTCQICGNRGIDLQVDHIQSWKEYIELRFNINNCRTLCVKCHYKITFGKPMPPTVRAWGHNLKEELNYSSI